MNKREEMLQLREKLIKENPDIILACELAPLMGEFQNEYWDWQIENYLKEVDDK